MKIFQVLKSTKIKKVKLFGLYLYKKYVNGDKITRHFLYLIKTVETTFYKKYYFCKLKILTRIKQDVMFNEINFLKRKINDVFYNQSILPQIDYYHRNIFPKYRRLYEGRDVILLACGPTATQYTPIKNGIHVGVNGAVRLPFKLDYLFLTDLLKADTTLNDDIDNYDPSCIKFYAMLPPRRNRIMQAFPNSGRIPQYRFYNANAIPFLLEDAVNNNWAIELACEPFGDFGGSVFSALQFILYTHPKRLFIVGCDCNKDYFYKTNFVGDNTSKIRGFNKFRQFVQWIYPDVEIYSINPVGLKGMFNDIYTDNNGNYVTEYGEIIDIDKEIIL